MKSLTVWDEKNHRSLMLLGQPAVKGGRLFFNLVDTVNGTTENVSIAGDSIKAVCEYLIEFEKLRK